MTDDQQDSSESPKEKLLRDIREDYSYFRDFWRENHDEAKVDLRFVSGDPWDPSERKSREDNQRPVVSPDELGQYLNQTINNLLQNKRAVKVNPAGNGANDQNALHRAAIIHGIEYKSNAQGAYSNAFENAINCGFGSFRITTKVISKENEVEPRIKIIENPLSVLLDPNAKEPDFSDQKRCFVMDVMRQRDFAKKYPKAQKKSFTADDAGTAPGWIFGTQNIVVAEYWRIDGYDENGDGGTVTQYVTNGLEILEQTQWPGKWIPIIPVMGKKVYIPEGDYMRPMYYSMIRKARGPQMMLAYIASQEAEEYGMAPRAPVMGYVGQFETDEAAWDNANKVPLTRLQIDPVVDGASGQVLPLPVRNPFIPNAQAYEIGFERWRRSIQAAMGITALPTAAQRQNEKSGVALEKIQTQQAVGSYHFTDNFDKSLQNAGRQLDDLITKVMDTPRQVTARAPDESHSLMHVVPQGQVPPAGVDPRETFDPSAGDFDVTISTGMSYQSQREEASAFVDLIVQEMAQIPAQPQQKLAILSKAIKLKDVGPIGDEIAKILDPQGDGEPIPPQAQAAIAQLQQHAQEATQMAQQLAQEKQGKMWETQGKLQQIAAQSQADMALEDKKLLSAITVAEISTKAQNVSERMAALEELMSQLHSQAHEAGLQAQDQAHEAQQQAQQQSHQQDMAAQGAQSQSDLSAQNAAQSQAAQQATQ